MVTNALDSSLLFKSFDNSTRDRTVHLKLVHKDCTSDAEDLGDLACNLSPSFFVEENIVVELVLYLDLCPGLFLGFGLAPSFLSCLSAFRRIFACVFSALLCFGLNETQISTSYEHADFKVSRFSSLNLPSMKNLIVCLTIK